MMGRILRRFPDLDLFWDTGDAHHNNATDAARRDWTDIIAGGCQALPFYYTAGNHEITSWSDDCDVELRCAKLGSLTCRPYYSFDLMGIHFLSLPEQIMMSFVTEEALAWARLDLALNRDKTTIILSHNSINGTTQPHDDLGYRRLANSAQVFDFINQWPNVVAWMHGHNHTWEIVQKQGKFYVSNGRIGGYNPPYPGYYGRGHLGGMYFEIAPDRVTIRGYSATEDKFFDELPHYGHLTQTIELKTTLDPHAPAAYSYGHGALKDGERVYAANHHTASGRAELFLAGAATPLINENPDFSAYTQRTIKDWKTKHLIGYDIQPLEIDAEKTDHSWDFLNPGVRINAQRNPRKEKILNVPGMAEGAKSYYRCAPGKSYRVRMELDAKTGGQAFQLICQVHGTDLAQAISIPIDQRTLQPGFQVIEETFALPSLLEHISLYTDPSCDVVYNVLLQTRLSNLSDDVLITRLEFMLAGAEGPTRNPALTIDGQRFAHAGELRPGQIAKFKLNGLAPARSVFECEAEGNGKLAWLVRQVGLAWQVRNAMVADRGDHLEIGPLRNPYSEKQEAIIAPIHPVQGAFIHRLRRLEQARVYPARHDGPMRVEVQKLGAPDGEIEVLSASKPQSIKGAAEWSYQDGRALIKVTQPGTITITV